MLLLLLLLVRDVYMSVMDVIVYTLYSARYEYHNDQYDEYTHDSLVAQYQFHSGPDE